MSMKLRMLKAILAYFITVLILSAHVAFETGPKILIQHVNTSILHVNRIVKLFNIVHFITLKREYTLDA